ncbi:MAG: histidine kinase [Actinobacteria bacterium]|nr:histidine kinase [Actinomycetota bacterium]
MMASLAPWETRVHKTIVAGQWVALTIGIISDVIGSRGDALSLVPVALSAAYVITATLLPETRFHARFGSETITLVGAVVLAVALTLSGGAGSPYLLLSMGPPILSTLYGGLRVGLMTGMFSSGLLVVVTLARGSQAIEAAAGGALYLVFVLLVGAIRKLFEDIHQQATNLAMEKETATQQLERLEQIHGALLRLSEDVSAGRLNAVEVAADTLDTILERFPGSAGKLAIYSESGPVVLAARGIPQEEGHVHVLPLSTNDNEVGTMELTTPEELTPTELDETADVIHPVSLAFANLQLLQEIVGSAVAEERTRLAREMHDEIGPSLASLGLALDLAAMQQASHPELASDLQVLRSNVTKLVEDVRASVADLRTAPGPTLTARILQGTAGFGAPPTLIVDIEERRPPRAAIIGDLTSILIEATRNAHVHSGGSKIVVSGQVDRNFGRCVVADDGSGFDPENEPAGHFGLLGMKERAGKIGASIKFDSKTGEGATVTVEWGNR